ncbi:MAG: peptidase T [Oscillospiraceae bacterium]|nr:peptidase T [Oscillospiraceae bacterium]
MKAYERLLQYARIHTSSAEGKDCTPSTPWQFDLSRVLETEMKTLGFADVCVDEEHAYVYGRLPASAGCESLPCIALIAHLDTVPDADFSGLNVRPQLVPDYDGGDLPLGDSGRVLSPSVFPDLKKRIGHTLITTDGTTVLGADDKAGIAEILTACEELLRGGIPHGPVAVCFPPDEEIGHGAALLDLQRLGADFAYTVDGADPAEYNAETFNAAAASVLVRGVNVHPGDAKNKMRNASLIAMEFHALLPAAEQPACTEGYEGFFHLTGMTGSVEQASLSYIVRDHDAAKFAAREETLRHAAKYINEKYGDGTLTLELREQYRNMAEVLQSRPEITERAEKAIRAAGLEPVRVPIRGGTDGSQLSFRGLPCPNLGTGGAGFHGPYEHISVEAMDRMVTILIHLLRCD